MNRLMSGRMDGERNGRTNERMNREQTQTHVHKGLKRERKSKPQHLNRFQFSSHHKKTGKHSTRIWKKDGKICKKKHWDKKIETNTERNAKVKSKNYQEKSDTLAEKKYVKAKTKKKVNKEEREGRKGRGEEENERKTKACMEHPKRGKYINLRRKMETINKER